MPRLQLTACAAALILASVPAFGQVSSPGSGSGSPTGAGTGAGTGTGTGGVRAIQNLPDTNLQTGRGTTTVPDPAANPNNQVPQSGAGLPGGGVNTPLAPGSGIGEAVPTYGAQDNSGLADSINESATRSQDTECSGTGTRSSTGSGSASATTTNCAGGGLGTSPIMGNSGAIDVRTP